METSKDIFNDVETLYAETQQAWRNWLEKNCETEKSVWLIIYRKESKVLSVYYPEAVDEALCFGWIDSVPKKRNAESYYQFFSKRNPKSNWSKVNKDKVARLKEKGLIAKAGQRMIDIAMQSGTWNALDKVELLEIPEDLSDLFSRNKTAFEYWEKFSKSSKRGILEWILNAKKAETRQKRLLVTVSLAERNLKANHKN